MLNFLVVKLSVVIRVHRSKVREQVSDDQLLGPTIISKPTKGKHEISRIQKYHQSCKELQYLNQEILDI